MKDRTPVRITLTDVASALPDLVLAGTFALVWLDPTRPGLPSVRRLVRRDFLLMGTWAFTVAAYLLAVAIGVMANVPALGISASVIDAQGFAVGGLWTEHPQTALAAGTIYFAIVAVWELLIPPIIFRHDREMAAMERASGIVTARTSSPRI
jgi:hypothetical protein